MDSQMQDKQAGQQADATGKASEKQQQTDMVTDHRALLVESRKTN